MHDALYCGNRFRTLNMIYEGTRECLAIEVDTSLPADRVIRVLERLKEERGLPEQIRVDNGPELISVNLLNYCEYTRYTSSCMCVGSQSLTEVSDWGFTASLPSCNSNYLGYRIILHCAIFSRINRSRTDLLNGSMVHSAGSF
ncbi:MAG: transposase [Proteobacteria bacterium]|nr:transposase [Pseudomonadota bacterium]